MHNNTRYTWNKNFPNGDYYNGEAVGDNVKDGVGEYYWAASGATYKGDWRNDLMHGHGVLTVPGRASPGSDQASTTAPNTSRGYTYDGAFLGGKRAGRGTCQFANGRLYEGEWADDQMHGHGTLRGAPGLDNFITYTGSFETGMRSGAVGICHYANGDTYEGAWRGGKRHGAGVLRFAAPSVDHRGPGDTPAVLTVYKGPFVQDAAVTTPGSTAEMEYSDGSRYAGGVDSFRREGDGTWQLANGDFYRGQFHLDCREGRGTLTSHDGSTYEGTWVRDKLSGRVNYKRIQAASAGVDASPLPSEPAVLPLLTSYQGPCVEGELSGAGARATFSDGSVYKGSMRQGLPDGDGVWEQCHLRGLPTAHFGDSAYFCRYEGQLSCGVPEGEGKGTLELISPASAGAVAEHSLPPQSHGVRIVYRRNGAYAGHWVRGSPHGVGLWKWDGGEVYTGDIHDGVAHGHGVLKNAQEMYEGDFLHGQPDGRGSYEHHLLHEHYDGEWSAGLFHGHGTYAKADPRHSDERVLYEGSWRHGHKHGEGTESVGAVSYEGSFARGHYEGQGKVVMNGETVLRGKDVHFTSFEGQFHDGLPSGSGRMVMRDGSTLTGSFSEGIPNGTCHAEFVQGLVFDGVYDHGTVTGEGCLRYPNGDQYVGSVEPATGVSEGAAGVGSPSLNLVPQRHGKGVFTFAEGNQLSCVWVHNVLHGDGVYTVAATGEKTNRHYVDGVLASTPGAGGGVGEGNVFTPENMFPNTQSEEVLKERMASKKRKPFAFVRKGESRLAANAPRDDDALSGGGANDLATPRSTAPRTSLRSGSVDGRVTKKAIGMATASTTGSAKPAPTVAKGVTQKAQVKPVAARAGERMPRPSQGKSPRPSLRGANSANAPAGRPSLSSQPQSSTRQGSLRDSRELLERFQQGITYVDSSGGAKSHLLTFTDGFSQLGVTDSDVPHDTHHHSARPRGPLTGDLKAMMDEASAIRSSKEDEIHLLTEELRQLNEKIWQLRFSLSSVASDNTSPNHLRSDVLASRLAALAEERAGTVSKLSCLLREPL